MCMQQPNSPGMLSLPFSVEQGTDKRQAIALLRQAAGMILLNYRLLMFSGH